MTSKRRGRSAGLSSISTPVPASRKRTRSTAPIPIINGTANINDNVAIPTKKQRDNSKSDKRVMAENVDNNALPPKVSAVTDDDDPETETSDSIPLDSESEAEELEEDYDERDEGVEINETASATKNVDYMWLVTTLVNTAIVKNTADEGGTSEREGKGKEISIEDQEQEFVRQVDEYAPGLSDNTQAAYKSTYRPYMGNDVRPKSVKILVPYGVSRVNQAYSAIIYLWTLQTTRLQQKSTVAPIRPSILIDEAIETYKRSLVSGILKAEHMQKDENGNNIRIERDDTTDSYATTNKYSVDEHIKIMLYTWQQLVTARSAGMREHFTLAVRHAMLLRDEDLRRLNIASCTVDTIQRRLDGTQAIMTMVFSIHGGKNSQHGYRQEGVAVRHHDVRRCSIGEERK
ncbi:hypothetical protein BGZ96_003436 [Linnemannia gamsii]|uniref:Uncharacterized protein n=1 Tax=Linnemannia gamsii TaxID=64522 RepID=A0ABQ7JJ68_9FUNG|nr:hypothetical protein BGZ96_003436 [Linnemannia gamsii]